MLLRNRNTECIKILTFSNSDVYQAIYRYSDYALQQCLTLHCVSVSNRAVASPAYEETRTQTDRKPSGPSLRYP
jgi:hypothetical protein